MTELLKNAGVKVNRTTKKMLIDKLIEKDIPIPSKEEVEHMEEVESADAGV
jgi:hypothetical protein